MISLQVNLPRSTDNINKRPKSNNYKSNTKPIQHEENFEKQVNTTKPNKVPIYLRGEKCNRFSSADLKTNSQMLSNNYKNQKHANDLNYPVMRRTSLIGSPYKSPNLHSCSASSRQVSVDNNRYYVHLKDGFRSSKAKETYIINKRSREVLNEINEAIRCKKLFTIGNQNKKAFPTIRNALKMRGWVEICSAQVLSEEGLINTKTFESIKNLLKQCPVNFLWAINSVDFININDETIVSRFPKNIHFTTKVGLCTCLEGLQWFHYPGVSNTVVPKTLKISSDEDIEVFMKEYTLTGCVSLLKMVVSEVTMGESDRLFRGGTVPIAAIDFANAQCSEYILHRQHDDIDRQQSNHTSAREWKEFLTWFHMIAHEKESFETTPCPMIQALFTMSKITLQNIKPFWPQLELEGCKNLWVVKPAAQFCGRGIKVMRNSEDIINHLLPVNNNSRHVVQKYIEHPLLIYDTKFDIRQWFLITSVYPLVIWIYTDCYLRFSSQPFSLDDLHESIHLTNNSIQRNYSNNSARNPRLPEQNMWHRSTFQDYLMDIGEPDKWCSVIQPGLRQGIIGAVLASQEEMIERQNSFELYGADFMVGSDYTPVLLEINMGPSMAPSTAVTAELCKSGLEDVIRVVLDNKNNVQASTGKFEILYKQEMGPRLNNVGLELVVHGSKITPGKKVKANK